MEKLQKLKVFPFAKFQAILLTLIGLLCGIIYSFGGLIIDILVSLGLLSPDAMTTPGLSKGTLLAFGALIGMPLFAVVVGFVTGVIEAVLYNLFVKWFGAISIDFMQKG